MITFLAALCGGVVSAVITLALGQPLQHYFWTRQRHAERQMAIIEEVNTLAAEARALLTHPETSAAQRPQLYARLLKAHANVKGLFSEAAFTDFLPLDRSVRGVLIQAETATREDRHQLDLHLLHAHTLSLIVLYRDLGIPAPPFGQWLRALGWDPLRRGWRERWWPSLQQRLATGTARLRQSWERTRRRRLGIHQPHDDI